MLDQKGRQILNNKNYVQKIVGDKSMLTIKKFQTSESTGIYQCYAKNEYGAAQADLLVIPMDTADSSPSKQPTAAPSPLPSRPMIIMGPQNTTIYEGQTVVLLCVTNDASSGGNTQINWLQNEIIIEPTLMRRFEINQLLGNLRIVSIQKSDAGIYKCIASNEYGMSTAEAFVKVVKSDNELAVGLKQSIKRPVASLVASRPSINQIGSDKILLNWQLIDSVTGLVVHAPDLLNTVAYFKVEYKTSRHNVRKVEVPQPPPTNVWLTIDEQVDPKKREYILTDLSKFETYRFRVMTFFLNGDLTNSHPSIRFRLEQTWTDVVTTSTVPIDSAVNELPLSRLKVQITQIWAIATSSLGLSWKIYLPTNQVLNHTALAHKLNGFYIYYRRIGDNTNSVNPQAVPPMPIVNYTRIKVPVNNLNQMGGAKSLVDSYMIENLEQASVYEIKMSCYNLIGDLCAFSEPLYGITLTQSDSMSKEYLGEPAEITPVILASPDKAKSNEILLAVLGTVLAVFSLVLVVFVVMCVVRHKEHKNLLAQLHNTSHKMTSSSCPTLIYEDSIRQNCQARSNYTAKLIEANIFGNSNTTNTTDTNSSNSQSMSTTTSSMATPPLISDTAAPSHMLLMNGNTVAVGSGGLPPPPPIPQVPPPQIFNGKSDSATLNRININMNPLNGYLDTTAPMSPSTKATFQENFYHTLTTLGNLPQLNDESNTHHFHQNSQHQYADFHNTTLNLRAHLLLKQQQQQILLNTLKTLNMKQQQQQQQQQPTYFNTTSAVVAESNNPKSPTVASMRRNSSVSSSKKSKKSLRRDHSTASQSNEPLNENISMQQLLHLQQHNQQQQQQQNNYYLLPRAQQQQQQQQQQLSSFLNQAPLQIYNDMDLLNLEVALNQNNISLFNGGNPNGAGIYLLNNQPNLIFSALQMQQQQQQQQLQQQHLINSPNPNMNAAECQMNEFSNVEQYNQEHSEQLCAATPMTIEEQEREPLNE